MPVKPPRSRNLGLHLTFVTGMLVCGGAFVVELLRVTQGNTLSWVYVIEWPVLGITGSYLWWKLLHEDRTTSGTVARKQLRRDLDAAALGSPSPKRDPSPSPLGEVIDER
jgi:hypothetical protein